MSKISKIDTIIKKSPKKTQKTILKSKHISNQCQFTHKSRFQSKFRHQNQNITQNLKSESKVTHRNTVLSKSIGDFSINRPTNAINKSSVPNHNNRPETQRPLTFNAECNVRHDGNICPPAKAEIKDFYFRGRIYRSKIFFPALFLRACLYYKSNY